LQNRSGVRRIATDRVSSLPWLPPPAGYIILIQDVAYGNRYKIARHQRLDRHLMRRGADFPFETRVAQILEADNAAQAERDLRDELAPGAPADEWFDLQRYPLAKPSPAPQPGMASLRDLALNDVDAESLLQGAKIVDASSQPANPQRPAAREGSAPDRRWLGAIALGLAVLAIVLAAGRSSDIQRVISSIVAELPGRSAPRPSAASPTRVGASRTLPSAPTPTAAGSGEVFYTDTRARARSCAILSCRTVEILDRGVKITARRVAIGQYILGSDRWIEFLLGNQVRFIHSSALSTTPPRVEPTPEPSPTARPAKITAAADSKLTVQPARVAQTTPAAGETYYVKSRARARLCARLNCAVADVFEIGERIEAAGFLRGDRINNSGRWIAFTHGEQTLYLHSSYLSAGAPLGEPIAAASPTTASTRIQPKDEGAGATLYVKKAAYVRRCPRLTCDIVEILPPGSKITVEQYESGQLVDGSDRWIRTTRNSRYAYVHSANLTKLALRAEATLGSKEEGGGEVYFVKTRTPSRTCPHLDCERAQSLPPGMRIVAARHAEGQPLAGDSRWIQFMFGGWIQYIHISALSRDKPTAEPTAQASPTATATSTMTEPPPTAASTATAAPPVKYVVETAGNLNANIRSCPSTSCAVVANFAPGTEVDVLGSETGETVFGTDVWLEISLDGGGAFIHSALVVAK